MNEIVRPARHALVPNGIGTHLGRARPGRAGISFGVCAMAVVSFVGCAAQKHAAVKASTTTTTTLETQCIDGAISPAGTCVPITTATTVTPATTTVVDPCAGLTPEAIHQAHAVGECNHTPEAPGWAPATAPPTAVYCPDFSAFWTAEARELGGWPEDKAITDYERLYPGCTVSSSEAQQALNRSTDRAACELMQALEGRSAAEAEQACP